MIRDDQFLFSVSLIAVTHPSACSEADNAIYGCVALSAIDNWQATDPR